MCPVTLESGGIGVFIWTRIDGNVLSEAVHPARLPGVQDHETFEAVCGRTPSASGRRRPDATSAVVNIEPD